MMERGRSLSRVTLLLAGIVALCAGLGLVTMPQVFFASYGIELGAQPSMLSEIRAPGALLVAVSVVLLLGALVEAQRVRAAWLGSLCYLSYAAARLVSAMVDGLPHLNLLYAGAGELFLGLACGWVYLGRSRETQQFSRL